MILIQWNFFNDFIFDSDLQYFNCVSDSDSDFLPYSDSVSDLLIHSFLIKIQINFLIRVLIDNLIRFLIPIHFLNHIRIEFLTLRLRILNSLSDSYSLFYSGFESDSDSAPVYNFEFQIHIRFLLSDLVRLSISMLIII